MKLITFLLALQAALPLHAGHHGDLNKDGKPDVIVANKKGVFVFTQP